MLKVASYGWRPVILLWTPWGGGLVVDCGCEKHIFCYFEFATEVAEYLC